MVNNRKIGIDIDNRYYKAIVQGKEIVQTVLILN